MITKNRKNNEVWSCNKISSESTQKSGFEIFLLIGSNSALNTSTTSSFDWIITFDENDIVEDYSLISSIY